MATIRPITEADYDAVAEIHVRTWQAAYAGIVPADYLASLEPAVFAEWRRTHPAPPGATTLVAEKDGRIVGFVGFGPCRDDASWGEIYAIYVSPDQWGRGAGRELLSAARAALTAAGFPAMRLWVLTENHPARRFYERMGLTPDGVSQTYTPRGTTVELPELRYATGL